MTTVQLHSQHDPLQCSQSCPPSICLPLKVYHCEPPRTACSLQPVGSPAISSSCKDGSCTNIVLAAQYLFLHNGTAGMQEARIYLDLGNASSVFLQEHECSFRWADQGNLTSHRTQGYTPGSPIPLGNLVRNGTQPAAQEKASAGHVVRNETEGYLSLARAAIGGECDPGRRHRVLFSEDVKSKCTVAMATREFSTAACTALQERAMRAMLQRQLAGVNGTLEYNLFLARTGGQSERRSEKAAGQSARAADRSGKAADQSGKRSSQSDQSEASEQSDQSRKASDQSGKASDQSGKTSDQPDQSKTSNQSDQSQKAANETRPIGDDWVRLLLDRVPENVVTGQRRGNRLYCSGMITGIHLEILHAAAEDSALTKTHPVPHRILGAALRFKDERDVSWRKCRPENCTDVLDVSLVSFVTFQDATRPSKYHFVGAPNLDVTLPYDFFYPFLAGGAGRGRPCGLTVAWVCAWWLSLRLGL